MTVFPDGTKERLHGHNYTTEITLKLKDASLDQMVPFLGFKQGVREICELWDEKLLLAEKCPFLKVFSRTPQEVEFTLCNQRYVLPYADVLFLPLDNVTTEALSYEFCRVYVESLKRKGVLSSLLSMHVRIDESPGQGASFSWGSP